jgi:ceramide glucosyltransferase
VILNATLGSLALLSLALLLWQWLAAVRFPLHQRAGDLSFAPAVTLLKSLKGCDAATEDCLRSWFAQEYGGEIQILFGVAAADDPVCEVVRKLIGEFPKRDAQLIVVESLIGANAKVSKLAELEKRAKHDILVVSDADVRVPSDLLANVVMPLSDVGRAGSPLPAARTIPMEGAHGVTRPTPEVGLVNCFYRLANPSTLAMQWEAIAINADFWSQVLQSKSLKPLDFALGAVMITRRKQLEEIGGFKTLVDCLADDYQLGNRIARNGHRIELCPIVVECWDPPMNWRAVWKHQLRWARTIRVCQPVPYFFSILSNPTLWPLVWLATVPTPLSLGFFSASLFIRLLVTENLQHRFTQSPSLTAALAPIKDLLQAAIWLCAFLGDRIEWRGRRFRLRKDGTLTQI